MMIMQNLRNWPPPSQASKGNLARSRKPRVKPILEKDVSDVSAGSKPSQKSTTRVKTHQLPTWVIRPCQALADESCSAGVTSSRRFLRLACCNG